MNKYIGKYRVDIERDSITGNHIIGADTFLRVDSVMRKRGGKVYRYDESTLVAYIPSTTKGINVYLKMIEKIFIVNLIEYDDGFDIYFLENDLESVADIIGVSSYGASKVPESIVNHPFKTEIQEEKRKNRTPEEIERFRLLGERLKKSQRR